MLYAALAALAFVLLDVLRKVLGRRLSPVPVVIGLSSGATGVFAAVLYREGIPQCDGVFFAIASVEVLTFSLSSVLYVQAVHLSPLSLTIPYLSLTPVITSGAASILLGEVPGVSGMFGIFLTAAGAWLLHLEPGLGVARLVTAPFREPGSWRMIVVALIWGTTGSLDKIAIAHGSEALLGFCLSAGSATLLLGLRVIVPRLGEVVEEGPRVRAPSRAWGEPLLYGAAIVSAVAVLCQFWAYRELMVAYVETIKRAGGLLSALAGTVFFGETGSWFRLPAAALMVMGVILIVW